MNGIAIAFGIADATAGAGRLHVSQQGARGAKHAETGRAAVLSPLVLLHVLDHVVHVRGRMAEVG